MHYSGQQRMRWSYLPHQQQEALKFIAEFAHAYFKLGCLYSTEDGTQVFGEVSKRTLRELVRHKLISIGYNNEHPFGESKWYESKIKATPLGREWGVYPTNSQK